MRNSALAEVAEELAKAGRHDRAEALARAIPDPEYRDRPLAVIAEELARSGDFERAEALARSVPGQSELISVAAALAKAATTGRARRPRQPPVAARRATW